MKTNRLLSACAAVLGFVSVVPLRAAELGQPAAALNITEWVKGKPVDLSEGKAKNVYVVEFWATWCGPCRVSIPHLTEMQKKFADKGVVFVGVSDEPAGTVTPFVEKMGDKMEYRVAVDTSRKTHENYMKAFGVGGIPHAFVVDKTGAIAWHGHPMAGLERTLEEILGGSYDIDTAKKAAAAEKLLPQYFSMVSSGEKDPKAAELGGRIVTDAAKNPGLLNEFAWAILTDKRVKERDIELALRAAKAAFDAIDGKDAAITDTYARALFDTGKKAEAIKRQKQAIETCNDPRLRAQLEDTLKGYEAKAKD